MERPLAAERLVEDDRQGEEVAASIQGDAPDLLGGHVARRPQGGPRLGEIRRLEACHAEIGDLRRPIPLADQDVGRLDIPVDDSGPVGQMQGVGQDGAERQDPRGVQAIALLQALPQALPRHELHGDVGEALGRILAGVVDGDDARMREGGGGLGFPEEPLVELLRDLPGDPFRQGIGLHRHLPVKAGIVRQVDHAHGAPAELTLDLVPADLRHALNIDTSPGAGNAAGSVRLQSCPLAVSLICLRC